MTHPSPRVFTGSTALPPEAGRVAIVVARWNEQVTRRLLDAAVARFAAAGLAGDSVDVVWVPGSFELPLVADRLAASGRYAAVVCLGAIIRGETAHDRHIAQAVARGIEAIGRDHGLPVIFGVLTCESLAQAFARAGDDPAANKGAEAAAAALEMLSLLAQLPPAAVSRRAPTP